MIKMSTYARYALQKEAFVGGLMRAVPWKPLLGLGAAGGAGYLGYKALKNFDPSQVSSPVSGPGRQDVMNRRMQNMGFSQDQMPIQNPQYQYQNLNQR
jgi:hypothetical protein